MFQSGYRKIQSRNILPNITWQEDTEFYKDFVQFLKTSDTELVCGITDDCVFYRQINITQKTLEDLFSNENIFCFSFRLGLNTTLQDYSTGRHQPSLSKYHNYNTDIIYWNWKQQYEHDNYGYPISLDGHVFRTSDLYDLTIRHPTGCLRHWEGNLAGKCREDVNRPYMASEETSSLYCIPTNCVQDPPLQAGLKHHMSSDFLNTEYLSNNIIDYDSVIKNDVTWSHNEIDLHLREYKHEY